MKKTMQTYMFIPHFATVAANPGARGPACGSFFLPVPVDEAFFREAFGGKRRRPPEPCC